MDRAWIAIGLMSGTSADAADAALIRVSFAPEPRVELLGWASRPLPQPLRQRILRACLVDGGSTGLVSELNVEIGEAFAAVALEAAAQGRLPIQQVDVIGSHGQTIFHAGNSDAERIRSTLQTGEPAVIAERTGCTVVSGFRNRDIAAGGQGAPLVPYVDWLLYRSVSRGRVLLNVGGIANVTVLPAASALDAVRGFDTGPGNMLIDAMMTLATDGHEHYDVDGRAAARGRVDAALLAELLRHSFFQHEPPRSAGREEFGEEVARRLWNDHRGLHLTGDDLLATVTAVTVESVAQSLEAYVFPYCRIDELYLSGGGARNQTLVTWLRRRLPDVQVLDAVDLGFEPQQREAVAFAVLAVQTLRGVHTNVPAVTGASHPVLLGSITPGRRFVSEQSPFAANLYD